MRRITSTLFISSAFISVTLLAVSAFGQYGPPQGSFGQSSARQTYDRPYGDRDYARQDRALFDRARMNLDHASALIRMLRARIANASMKPAASCSDFESRFDQGRYEKHHLDEAIDHIQHVVNSNSLDPRDRGALAEDLRRMRDYREFRNHHGDREYENGYR